MQIGKYTHIGLHGGQTRFLDGKLERELCPHRGWYVGSEWINLAQRPVVASCDNGNETSSSRNIRSFQL